MQTKTVPVYFEGQMLPPTFRGEIARDVDDTWYPTGNHWLKYHVEIVNELLNNPGVVLGAGEVLAPKYPVVEQFMEYEKRILPQRGGKRKKTRKSKKSVRKSRKHRKH
jgi:hypothetical protein